jgi:hypothetical protein
MHTVFVVYKTDHHHSYASRDIIGIATDMYQALNLAKEHAAKPDKDGDIEEGFNDDQEWLFLNIKQTQGCELGEYQTEALKTNELF